MHTPGPLEVLDRKTEISVNRGLVDVFEITTVHGAYQDFTTTGYAFSECDARLYSAAPELLKALEATLAWLTNCNVNDPATLGRQIMAALEKAGVEKELLDDAAVALVRGPCAVPNLMGDEEGVTQRLIDSLGELVEIGRSKISPTDEVILASGRSNHTCLFDAYKLLAEIEAPIRPWAQG